MKEQEFKNKQEEMSDEMLIALVEVVISNLAKTGGLSHRMTVPPRIDDTDMLLSEMVRRFKNTLKGTE